MSLLNAKQIIKTARAKINKSAKFDYSDSKEDIFYKIIYPIFSKEFLFSHRYETFKSIVQTNFILNEEQWEEIAKHWDRKEEILKIL